MDKMYPTLRNFLLLLLMHFPFSSTFSPTGSSSWASDVLYFLPIVIHLQLIQRVLQDVQTHKDINIQRGILSLTVSSSHPCFISCFCPVQQSLWIHFEKKKRKSIICAIWRKLNRKQVWRSLKSGHTRLSTLAQHMHTHLFYINHLEFKQTPEQSSLPFQKRHSTWVNLLGYYRVSMLLLSPHSFSEHSAESPKICISSWRANNGLPANQTNCKISTVTI